MVAERYVKYLFKVIARFIIHFNADTFLSLRLGLIDRSDLNFDKSFLHFNVKKNNICKKSF